MRPNEPHTLRWYMLLEDGRKILVETRDLLECDDNDEECVSGAIATITMVGLSATGPHVHREAECRNEWPFHSGTAMHKAAVLRIADANDWSVKSIEEAA